VGRSDGDIEGVSLLGDNVGLRLGLSVVGIEDGEIVGITVGVLEGDLEGISLLGV